MTLKTTKWDIQDHLKTEEEIAAYLEAAAEENDPEFLIKAFGNVARARGISVMAKQTGLSRQGLYDAFSVGGNPTIATIMNVAKAVNLRIGFLPSTVVRERVKVQTAVAKAANGRNASTGQFVRPGQRNVTSIALKAKRR